MANYKVYTKTVPVKDGIVQITHDDLYLIHLYHLEPYLHDDHEVLFLYIDEDEFVDLDELYCCGWKEVTSK